MSGVEDFRMASAVSALVRIEPSGWLISCAMEAVSSPAVEKRMTRASSDMRCRDCISARLRRRRAFSRAEISTGLQEKNGGGQRDLPRITLPCRWLPKQDFASRWQAAFADVPTPKLSPIVFRCRETDQRNLDTICFLASQHSDCNSSRRFGTLGR